MSFKKTFLPALILMAICLACAAALAFTNDLTKEKIDAVDRERYFAAAAAVLPEGAVLTELDLDGVEGFIAKDAEENLIGYAIKGVAKGYGGNVSCVVGFNVNGDIIGLSVTAPDETPGLGSNVQKPAFTDRFLGVSDAQSVDEIAGVTSATYSSQAVKKAVSEAIAVFNEITKGA